MRNTTIEQRKETLLAGNEVELAIEERFTNLRIFKGGKGSNIYFRLDKANAYSAPLSDNSISYLHKKNEVIEKLNTLFGFNNATLNDIDTILEMTKDLKNRPCISW